jgi:hypothetical protein
MLQEVTETTALRLGLLQLQGLNLHKPETSVCLRSRNHSLAAFVQPCKFYTTYHVAVLTPREEMTIQEKLWWCLCIRANRFRFHFGRQANRTIGSLILPEKVPDWAKEAKVSLPFDLSAYDSSAIVDTTGWQKFRVSEIFSLHGGQYASRRDLSKGTTPLVTASAWNNGITAQIGEKPDWEAGKISVANNGSIGAAFYQPYPFSASRDVTVLDPKISFSPAAALFVCTMLRKESPRFNYARKWTIGRMQETEILLPASGGNPDTKAMEELVKTLPLGWSLAPDSPT